VPLKPLTVQQAVVEAVRARIVSGRLAAGSRIDQDALAAEFGVSRMPIREALRQLGAEGFVTIVPHRGAIVTALSPTEVEEVYEIRAVLEALASRMAVSALTEHDLAKLGGILEAMHDEEQIDTWVALNDRFHNTIIQASNRGRLIELIQRIRHQSQPYVRLYVHHLHRSAQAREEHEAILAALVARDADKTESAVRSHLLSTGRAVAAYAIEAEQASAAAVHS
jgi:DNA-binding GntR family transcriptional regulator